VNTAAKADAEILVIDDDAIDLDLVQRVLTREGYRVATALDPHEGLQLARSIKPAAIILDVLMPEMDGWNVLKVLKAHETLRDCPVILSTVSDDIQKGRELGAAGHLVKPIHREPLLRLLAQVCGTSDDSDSENVSDIEYEALRAAGGAAR
jgi:CheY-like chemotaxis protein